MDRTASPPRRRPRHGSLRSPNYPLSPPTPPSNPDPSCHLLEIVSFSEEKETKDRAAFVSSLSSSPPFHLSPPFSSFISYFPCYPTHPLAWISALLYLPQQVDCCVFLCFFRPHARLARSVRYSAEPSIEFPGP